MRDKIKMMVLSSTFCEGKTSSKRPLDLSSEDFNLYILANIMNCTYSYCYAQTILAIGYSYLEN